jgi:hypothetical protein
MRIKISIELLLFMFIGMGESWVEWESRVLNFENIDPIFLFNQIVYVQTCGFRTYKNKQ